MTDRSTHPISEITVGDRHRSDLGDIDGLMASIENVGLLQPIVILNDGHLVAGQRRLESCRRLGFDEVPVRVVTNLASAAALLEAERDENTCRKDFTPSEAVALGRALEALEKPKAKERMSEGGKVRKVSGRSDTRDVVGAAVGMSGRSYEKAKAVVAAAEDETQPAVVRAIAAEARDEMDATGKVDPAFRRVKQAADAAAEDRIEGIVRQHDPAAGVDIDRARLKAKYSKRLAEVGSLIDLPATDVAEVLTREEKSLLTLSVRQIVAWAEEVTADRSLRLVSGGTR